MRWAAAGTSPAPTETYTVGEDFEQAARAATSSRVLTVRAYLP
jgi:hypothetical protein